MVPGKDTSEPVADSGTGGLLNCAVDLPPHFHRQAFLDFHARDREQVAESADAESISKGLVWEGVPSCLSITFTRGSARVQLAVDGPVSEHAGEKLQGLIRRMLGLNQPVEEFERAHAVHPQLGPLIGANPGLRIPVAATPFEALAWAVIGQQISLGAAVSIRRRIIQNARLRHSGGLLCFPDTPRIAAMTETELRAAGLSMSKVRTLRLLAEQVEQGLLPLEQWAQQLPAEEAGRQLLAIKGVGPWTVSYALLRGFGWLDGSLHGDVAVRRNLQAVLGRQDKISPQDTRLWLADFTPWRALVAAHLWARQSAAGY